jgi:hypothetical protein
MNRAERRAQRSKAAAFTYRMNIAKEQKKIRVLAETRGVQVVSFPTDHDKALAAKAVQKRRDREIHALMKVAILNKEFQQ